MVLLLFLLQHLFHNCTKYTSGQSQQTYLENVKQANNF